MEAATILFQKYFNYEVFFLVYRFDGMKCFSYIFGAICAILCMFYLVSEYEIRSMRAELEPIGTIADLPEGKMHYLDVNTASTTSAPVLFIHGASSNLNDHYKLFAFRKVGPPLSNNERLIFIDRPGHGYSELNGAKTPELQAKRYVELLDYLKIKQVVLVSHSMGSLSAIAMALNYPSRVKGVAMLAPIGYPDRIHVPWYFRLASTPILGPIFANTLVIPFKRIFLKHGMEDIFYPQIISRYFADYSKMEYELQPEIFMHNSQEVLALGEETKKMSKSYGDIVQDVIIVVGDADSIVDYSAQAVRLAENIPNAKLIILPGIGHKPGYQEKDLIMKAIMDLARYNEFGPQ